MYDTLETTSKYLSAVQDTASIRPEGLSYTLFFKVHFYPNTREKRGEEI